MTDGPPVLDEIEMQAIIEAGQDEGGEQFMRLFHGRVWRDPAEPARYAKDVGVDRKRRRY